MKPNNNIYIPLALLLGSIISGSCTSDFKDINTNKKVLSDINITTVGNVFAEVQYESLMCGPSSDWGQANFQVSQNVFSDFYSQYFSNLNSNFQSDRNVLVRDWLDIAWSGFYGYPAKDLEVVLDKTNPAENSDLEGQHALAQIWKVFMYQRITDYWGSVPYSQVNNGSSTVAYDRQQDIYADFIRLLDAATNTLASHAGKNAYGTNDQIYFGSIDKWIIFANTLRLRVAMRISKVDQTTAKEQAEKAVASNVMETNEDNAVFHVSPSINSENPLPVQLPWNEFRMSASMESVLKGFADPRLSAYWQPAVNTGLYTGVRNGLTVAQILDSKHHFDNLSTMSARWNTEGNEFITPVEVILASEAFFLRAEAALKGWNMDISAEEAYYKGIETSLEYWGCDPATIAAYQQGITTPVALEDFDTQPMTDIPVKWIEGDPVKELEQIITQKWIALFPMDGKPGQIDAGLAFPNYIVS